MSVKTRGVCAKAEPAKQTIAMLWTPQRRNRFTLRPRNTKFSDRCATSKELAVVAQRQPYGADVGACAPTAALRFDQESELLVAESPSRDRSNTAVIYDHGTLGTTRHGYGIPLAAFSACSRPRIVRAL